jgi:hypothetical protein
MNPLNAEIWDPGLLADSKSSINRNSVKKVESPTTTTADPSSDQSSDDEQTFRLKPPSNLKTNQNPRKLSFTKETFFGNKKK